MSQHELLQLLIRFFLDSHTMFTLCKHYPFAERRLLRAKDSGRRLVEKALTGRNGSGLEEKIMIDPDLPY